MAWEASGRAEVECMGGWCLRSCDRNMHICSSGMHVCMFRAHICPSHEHISARAACMLIKRHTYAVHGPVYAILLTMPTRLLTHAYDILLTIPTLSFSPCLEHPLVNRPFKVLLALLVDERTLGYGPERSLGWEADGGRAWYREGRGSVCGKVGEEL